VHLVDERAVAVEEHSLTRHASAPPGRERPQGVRRTDVVEAASCGNAASVKPVAREPPGTRRAPATPLRPREFARIRARATTYTPAFTHPPPASGSFSRKRGDAPAVELDAPEAAGVRDVRERQRGGRPTGRMRCGQPTEVEVEVGVAVGDDRGRGDEPLGPLQRARGPEQRLAVADVIDPQSECDPVPKAASM
jgi:hypothetical protein